MASKYFHLTIIQYFSPEKTIYKFLNSLQRFKNSHLAKLSLPFIGEWKVSQGYNGNITHLGDWSKALDFVIEDSKGYTYQGLGKEREQFYCYNREILAPSDGYIYDIIYTVEENDIGAMDTEKNWGNTIIMNHMNGLFSQISHIKKDSFTVLIGQYVTKGTLLAGCGNSGRSPEPHIHFQIQTTPEIGAKPIAYPFDYYISRKGTEKELKYGEVPNEGDFIGNVQTSLLLTSSFNLFPGLKICMQGDTKMFNWEVKTDAWNRTHIFCAETKSYAYFVNDGTMFYFTDFEGDKKSVLFHFYLAAYRQLLGYYENIVISDFIPLLHFNSKLIQPLQDILAPFYRFTKAIYESKFLYTDSIYAPQNIKLHTMVETKFLKKTFKKMNYEIELNDYRIHKFTIHNKIKSETFICSIEL